MYCMSASQEVSQDHQFPPSPSCLYQEVADGGRVSCATIVLDAFSDGINRRVGNCIYDRCRAKTLTLPGFLDFDPLIRSLKDGQAQQTTREYQVCVPQQANLIVLQSLAKKFVDAETTKEAATNLIQSHNEKFNPNGDFWLSDERTNTY